MSDAIVFGFGCFVTLMVGAAVSLLAWGAATEPSIDEVPDDGVAAPPLPRQASPSAPAPDRQRA